MNAQGRWNSRGAALVLAPLAALTLLVAGRAPAGPQPKEQATSCEEWTVPERRARAANPIPAAGADMARGQELYRRECASCHGETGRNDGPDTDDVDMSCALRLADPELLDRTDGELFWKIREGRGSMPNTLDVLRDQDRWLLVRYLRTLADNDDSRD